MSLFVQEVKCMQLNVEMIVKIKSKGIAKFQSKNNKNEYKKRLDGGECQKECGNYFIGSLNHEMYLQRVRKSTLSSFDDKRCCKNNN